MLCGICYKKADLRNITDMQLDQLQSLVDRSYSLTDIKFQTVLCKICALALTAHSRNPEKPGRKLLIPKYSNLRPPPTHETRAADGQACPCTVCEIAQCNMVPGGNALLQEKYWSLLFPEVPCPADAKTKTGNAIGAESRCVNCYAVVGKGRTHKCTKTKMQDNLHNIVKSKSLKSKEKIGEKF